MRMGQCFAGLLRIGIDGECCLVLYVSGTTSSADEREMIRCVYHWFNVLEFRR